MIKKRRLGNSGLQISELGFGGMSLGSDHLENERVIRAAIEEGIDFFDTADLYDHGFNEETVGRAVASIRQDVYLGTKVGNIWNKDGQSWYWGPTKSYILDAVDQSLRRLRTDYIDLYQLHGGTIDDPIDEIIEAFELLKASGKIRAYGISSIRPNVIREYAMKSSLSSVMLQYSILDRRPEEEVLGLLQRKGVGVLARGTLAKGVLVNKAPKDYLGFTEAEVLAIQQLLNSKGDPLQLALKFVVGAEATTSAILGIRNEAQLRSLVAGYHASYQIDQVLSDILPAPNKYQDHR